MLRKAILLCNIFKTRDAAREACARFLERFNPAAERCTVCGRNGACRIHAYYFRGLKLEDGQGDARVHTLRIPRVRCMACGHTHAVLPDAVVPYRRYGLIFIIGVLTEYYHRRETAEEICERRGFSLKTFYRWKEIFLAHLSMWQSWVKRKLSEALLLHLAGERYSLFNARFYHETAFSFLQGHRNAQNELYRHALFREAALNR